MAEVKNNFLGAKMNKDVDPRIIPPGEYRNALNLQINKSEGSNVGDLQTSLGNEIAVDFKLITGNSLNVNFQCIGSYADEKSNTIIFFFTDYNQPAGSPVYNELAKNYIYMYNDLNGAVTKLVEGAFLNFSITNPIIGVNLLEELLFWTDNRNQPRKINIVTAQQQPGYYTDEEQISVAKISPYIPIELYKISVEAPTTIPPTYETTMYDVTSKYLPDGGQVTTKTITTASTNVTLDFNGYAPTDFRPKPFQAVTGVGIVGNPFVVSFSEDALFPQNGHLVLNTIQTLPIGTVLDINPNPYYDPDFIGDPNYLQDKFARFSYRFKFDDGEYSIFAPFTQVTFIPKQDGYFKRSKFTGEIVAPTTKKTDPVQGGTTPATSAGFSISFEDSLTVPLPGQLITCTTLACISPETYVVEWNPPYLLMSKEALPVLIPNRTEFIFTTIPPDWQDDDQEATYKSTVVDFMQNKVNKILLRVILPCNGSDLRSKYKITSMDMLYKASDGLSVSVVDSIPVDVIATASPSSNVYEYSYDSKKPFKTLPEKDLIRVYDKTPIKALAQEIISNRVVYANYQDKATYPQYLNYNVKYSQKSDFNPSSLLGQNRTSIIEYPNHSLKQNRTYQVGIILEDFFGRQSGVIQSNSTTGQIGVGGLFKAASLFVPYRTMDDADAGGNALFFPGYSLKVLFNSIIPNDPPDYATGWPGLYNGNKTSPDYNPLGWYSYKIVVKQVEQDYYNVYLPGVLAGYPIEPFQKESITDPLEPTQIIYGKTSHIVLFNDNINKVPRDLQEVGPVQLQFRSSVKLYGRVENNILWSGGGGIGTSVSSNAQYWPGNSFLFANTIATTESLFGVTNTTPTYPFQALYQVNSNPLIARLSTPALYGVQTQSAPTPTTTSSDVISLAVLETAADQSLLDIYWETSSVGLISELNTAIVEGSAGATQIQGFDLALLTEALGNIDICSGRFAFLDVGGVEITDITVNTLYITNLLNTPRTTNFTLVEIPKTTIDPNFPIALPYDTFYLKTNAYFYYGPNAAINESYRFRFTVTTLSGVSSNITVTGALKNVDPEITDKTIDNIYPTTTQFVHHFGGLNGSNPLGGSAALDQLWAITSQKDSNGDDVNMFFVSNSTTTNANKRGSVYFINPIIPDGAFLYTVILRLTDAGGLWTQCTMYITPPS